MVHYDRSELVELSSYFAIGSASRTVNADLFRYALALRNAKGSSVRGSSIPSCG